MSLTVSADVKHYVYLLNYSVSPSLISLMVYVDVKYHVYLLPFLQDVPLVEFLYLVFTHIQLRVTVGDSGLCCCVRVTSFERYLTSLCVGSYLHSLTVIGYKAKT